MRTIHTDISIKAPIEKIWSVLMDFSSYPNWNPFILKIEGEARVGSRLTVTIAPPGKKTITFHPQIQSLSNYKFAWVGKLLFTGLFDGKHQFILEPEANGHVKFIQSEDFFGLLHIPIFNLIHASTQAGFEKMNLALKQYCEEGSYCDI